VDARAKREHDDREWSFFAVRLPTLLNRTERATREDDDRESHPNEMTSEEARRLFRSARLCDEAADGVLEARLPVLLDHRAGEAGERALEDLTIDDAGAAAG
jgi:hypothetical protein